MTTILEDALPGGCLLPVVVITSDPVGHFPPENAESVTGSNSARLPRPGTTRRSQTRWQPQLAGDTVTEARVTEASLPLVMAPASIAQR